MPRGSNADVGAERTSANGYHYTKVEDQSTIRANLVGPGWMLTHHITAAKKLGRPLLENEIVQFVDKKYKRDPHNIAGVKVIRKKTSSLRRRKAQVEARIAELQAELRYINKELEKL